MDYLKGLVVLFVLVCILCASEVFSQARKIKPGDVIEIVVYEHQELSRTITVSPEGTVNFPFMQNLPVDGITIDDFREMIVAQLARYIETQPIVTVSIVQSFTIDVTVLGQVVMPGAHKVSINSTIQGAIAQAGGFAPRAQLSRIKLIQGKDNHSQNHTIDFERFLITGDLSLLPPLRDGDIIIVPGSPGSTTVKVVGGVEQPGNYEIFTGANLLDVLFMAGGPSNDANLSKISLISPQKRENREVKVDIKHLLRLSEFKEVPRVNAGDIVYVPQRVITWRKFVGFVRDLTAFATLYIIIRWGRRYW